MKRTTISVKQLAREARQARREGLAPEPTDDLPERPATRADCCEFQRPCPFVSCRYNLFLDVDPDTGSIKFNFPGKELEDLEQTCALDVAEEGAHQLEVVGRLVNVTRERVRQMEARAVAKMGADAELAA